MEMDRIMKISTGVVKVLQAVLLVVLIVVTWAAIVLTWEARNVIKELNSATKNTLAKVDSTTVQAQRALQIIGTTVKVAGEELGNGEKVRMHAQQGTVNLLNRITHETLPLVDRNLLATESAVIASEETIRVLQKEAVGLNQEIVGLIRGSERELAELSKILNVSVEELNFELIELIRSGKVSVDTVTEELKDFDRLRVEAEGILRNLNVTTGNVASMSKHAKKWQPLTTAARVLSLAGILTSLF